MGIEVLAYIPNLIGYIRLVLVLAAFSCYSTNAACFLFLYSTNVILDGIDGLVARKLNQTSAFGAWLDVMVDNFGRGFLWSRLYKWGYVVAALEWSVFVCTHSLGAEWKANFVQAPYIAQKVMEKNFKTPLGTFTILGLHGLPIWLYAHYTKVLGQSLRIHRSIQYAGIAFLSAGRAVCLTVEQSLGVSFLGFLGVLQSFPAR
ncbi:uncharacterized protein [Apostichopus japonicus]|uniref:uncharacterized protein isoform X2 n=1 Tax=Stichopus japonicus TaxID=307972 RepID=UPI003AB14625